MTNTDSSFGTCRTCKQNIPTHVYDSSCVIENIMIAVQSLGVSSCCIHRAKETFEPDECKDIVKQFEIEDDYKGIRNIILSYPKTIFEPRARKKNYVCYID